MLNPIALRGLATVHFRARPEIPGNTWTADIEGYGQAMVSVRGGNLIGSFMGAEYFPPLGEKLRGTCGALDFMRRTIVTRLDALNGQQGRPA